MPTRLTGFCTCREGVFRSVVFVIFANICIFVNSYHELNTMKRRLLLFIFCIVFSGTINAQNFVPKNYRSLAECEQDTIAYLTHNWGLRSPNQFKNRTVGEFLNIYDLPIVSVMLRLGGSERLAIVCRPKWKNLILSWLKNFTYVCRLKEEIRLSISDQAD